MFKKLISLGAVFFCLFWAVTRVLAAPPTDFSTTQIIGSGLDGPVSLEFAPDGRIFILERAGVVKIYKDGNLLPAPFVTLPAQTDGDKGLIGVAFDPNFATNHWVYFYYTHSDSTNHVVRYSAVTDVATDGPFIVYQTSDFSPQLHVGGTIAFGPDGKLYIAVGDNGYPANAQDLDNPHGKILRINADGTVPVDNPFVVTPGADTKIWALGLRNPWRFQFDSVTGRLYNGDVGASTWEEINLIEKAKNYGWPTCEGDCTVSGMTNPLYTYNHDGESSSITGGPVYQGSMFPAEYQGRYFFGDYARGFIRTMGLDGAGQSTGVTDFDTEAGSVVDMKVAPDGSLYYVTFYPGRLYRVSYSTSNQVPSAVATSDVTTGIAPLTVHFSSTGSTDPNGDPLSFLWDLGDGTTSTETNPTKVYSAQGAYTVELTVSDGTNSSQAVPIIIQVGIPPTVVIGSPEDGSNYKAGDTITYSASAHDGVGNDLNDNNISTTVLFHHDTHTHPFYGPVTGRNGSFTLPTSGESDPDTWFEIIVTATDTNGLYATDIASIYPYKSNLTFATQPAGLQISLDGSPLTTPQILEHVVNFQREVSAISPQTIGANVYEFVSWSDDGAQTHTISTPDVDTTYTATFAQVSTIPGFNGEYFANKTLTGSPVLTRFDPSINFDWGTSSPGIGVPADNFSVRWSGIHAFSTGTYTFTVRADDGVRLFIDNILVLDKWIDQSATTYTLDRLMTAGSHALRLEYYENGYDAVADLSWETAPSTTDSFAAEFYNNQTLSGAPVLERFDPAINFDWGTASPGTGVNADNFSTRWAGDFDFTAGNHNFSVTADDGVRLYVDNVLVLDKWIDQSATTYIVAQSLTAGLHNIRLEYYENGYDAVAKASWQLVSTPTPTPAPTLAPTPTPVPGSFTGEYFANRTLSGTPALVRNDSQINFDWGTASPGTGVPADNFSVRWTGSFNFTAGTYTFTLTADDGFRFYVDNVLVLDKWLDQSATTYTQNQVLSSGLHDLRLEYYENGWDAVSKLSWVQASPTPTPPASTFSGQYFANRTLVGTPILTRTDSQINFDWGTASPGTGVPADSFSVRWTGDFVFTSGNHSFTVTADDGVRLFIDNVMVLDRWVDQSATTYNITQNLSAGSHNIRLEFYENGWDAVSQLSWN